MGDSTVSHAEVSRLLDAFEQSLDDLRIGYEKYFLGVDRKAPEHKHQLVRAKMRQLEQFKPCSTVLRFRLAGLRARLVTYQHHWTRVLGQIENGTYRRDLRQRIQRRRQAQDGALERSRPPPVCPAPTETRGPGLAGVEIRRLFEELVRAKQAAGEDTKGMTERALVRKLSRELPKLQQRHGVGVQLEVAIVGGKVRLRARPQPSLE